MPLASLLMSACLLAASEPEYDPTTAYTVQQIEGFTVRVSDRLRRERPAPCDEALGLLRVKLYDINRAVPAEPLGALRKVTVWVETEDVHGRHVGMCYHPSREWLTEHGYNPDKAGCIEVANVANFLSWSGHQPSMVLHELAHAYHHQVLGYDHAAIKQAYEHAKEGRLYESVLRYDGETARAYALNNDQEYFAELTEAYFGANDFYPFVRAEVRQYDPVAFAMLEDVWNRTATQ